MYIILVGGIENGGCSDWDNKRLMFQMLRHAMITFFFQHHIQPTQVHHLMRHFSESSKHSIVDPPTPHPTPHKFY